MNNNTNFPLVGKLLNYWLHLDLEFIHEMVYIFTTCINETKLYIKDNVSGIH